MNAMTPKCTLLISNSELKTVTFWEDMTWQIRPDIRAFCIAGGIPGIEGNKNRSSKRGDRYLALGVNIDVLTFQGRRYLNRYHRIEACASNREGAT